MKDLEVLEFPEHGQIFRDETDITFRSDLRDAHLHAELSILVQVRW